MTEPADRDLVAEILRSGDEPAFRVLYRRHTPRLYRLALRVGPGEAEDLVQELWIRAAARWAEFGWRSSLGTWLAGILLNLIRERYRAARRRPSEPLIEDWATDPPPLDDRLDLAQAIERLPPGYRAVVVMHDVEGYTHQDIATALGIDAGTSKSQLARARRALRRWLAPAPEAP